MGQAIIKTKKGKAIALVVMAAVTAGIYLFITMTVNNQIKSQEEAIRDTENLPEDIRHLLSGPTMNDDDNAFSDIVEKPVAGTAGFSFVRYIYFTDEIMGGAIAHTTLNAIYDKRINDLLGMNSCWNDRNWDGIILRKTNVLQVGIYKDKDGHGDLPAQQLFYTLTYVKLPERIVVHRDTVWGQQPAVEIDLSTGHRAGEPPTDEAIVMAVKKSVNKQ